MIAYAADKISLLTTLSGLKGHIDIGQLKSLRGQYYDKQSTWLMKLITTENKTLVQHFDAKS